MKDSTKLGDGEPKGSSLELNQFFHKVAGVGMSAWEKHPAGFQPLLHGRG